MRKNMGTLFQTTTSFKMLLVDSVFLNFVFLQSLLEYGRETYFEVTQNPATFNLFLHIPHTHTHTIMVDPYGRSHQLRWRALRRYSWVLAAYALIRTVLSHSVSLCQRSCTTQWRRLLFSSSRGPFCARATGQTSKWSRSPCDAAESHAGLQQVRRFGFHGTLYQVLLQY